MSRANADLCMGCMSPLQGSGQSCPRCGYSSLIPADPDYIRPGSALGTRYTAGRLTHKNGEGALYKGFDDVAGVPVWIHEYYPHGIAERDSATGSVLPLQGFDAQFKAQMSDFVDICNEVKRLSAVGSVIPIENLIGENNTVYAIYKDMDVIPLEEYLQSRGGKLPHGEAIDMFQPLFDTLSNLHGRGHIHRGISPYTVHADKKGKLYLWNFSLAATRTAGCELEAELFSGYSAPEQYSPSGWQGTWTDVYAVGALLYRTLSGTVPPGAATAVRERGITSLEHLVMGLPKNISDAVSAAMIQSSDRRTQAIATFVSDLRLPSPTSATGTTVADTAVYSIEEIVKARPQENARKPERRSSRRRSGGSEHERNYRDGGGGMSAKYVSLALMLTVTVLIGIIALFMYVVYPSLVPPDDQSSASPSSNSLLPDEDEQPAPVIDTSVPRLVFRNVNDVMSTDAFAAIRERYEFKIEQEYSDEWPEHTIIDQKPVEGTEMETGVITLTVSRGQLMLEMPLIEGLTLDEALIILESLNTDVELQIQIYTKYDSDAPSDTVVSTSPSHGTSFDPKRQQVVLFIAPQRQEETTNDELPREETPPNLFSGTNNNSVSSQPPSIIFR